MIESLVRDVQEFIAAEDWYAEAGIPHRRGLFTVWPAWDWEECVCIILMYNVT
jgi:hypothetical protein